MMISSWALLFTYLCRREVVQKDCQARKLNREDAMDRRRWNKLIKVEMMIKIGEWVNVSSGTSSPE